MIRRRLPTIGYPRDLAEAKRALHVGVGGGLEALQLATSCAAADTLDAMVEIAGRLLEEATAENARMERDFRLLRHGDALDLLVTSPAWPYSGGGCGWGSTEKGWRQASLSKGQSFPKGQEGELYSWRQPG